MTRTVDEYLDAVPAKVRTTLEKVRQTIRATVPGAEELISYQVPSYKYHYMLVGFAAFKDHCSFFVMSTRLMRSLRKELTGYDYSLATIRFPFDKPLPVALIKKIVKARLKENEERRAAKNE